MTQVHCLAAAIRNRNTRDFHNHASLHASIHGREIKSLEEISDVGSKEPIFNETDVEKLEAQAQKSLREAQERHGREPSH